MIDIRNVQVLVQLADNLNIVIAKLEKLSENSSEIAKAQNEILDIQKKISTLLSEHVL